MASPAYKKSKSGYYNVTLNKVWVDLGFTYRPSQAVVADEATLQRMIAAEVVDTITPVD